MFFSGQIKNQFFALATLFFTFTFSISQSSAQTPNWLWANSAGSSLYDYGIGVCNDNNGNTYSTGYFRESITFGDITLTDVGGFDIFVVKYDPNGNVLWANSYGGTSLDFVNNMSINADNHIVITGAFRSESISFGSFTLTNPNAGDGANCFYVMKIDTDGNVLWATTANCDSNCSGSDVDINSNGDIVVTGNFSGNTVTFGSITLTNSYQFADDFFIVKYNSAGEVLWAKGYGGNSEDTGIGVVFDNTGNINFIGAFSSSEITLGVTTYINSGGYDYLLVQFGSEGNISWMRNAQGNGDDFAQDIDVDNDNNIFITGNFSGLFVSFSGLELTGNSSLNIFTIKYDNGGNPEWVISPQGDQNDESYAITVDKDGNCLITGTFESSILSFDGSISITNNNLEYGDVFVAKINNDGIVNWATATGGNDLDYGLSISTNNEGNAFITGVFYSTSIAFGANTLVNANSSNNSPDYFIAKLNSTVGIDDKPIEQRSLIYPNPVVDNFNITTEEKSIIKLYSENGILLKTRNLDIGNNLIDVSTYKPGIYFVRIMVNDKVMNDKFIKR